MQNANICARIKIESIFWLFILKKVRRSLSLVIKVDNAKIVNMLIENALVLDHTLYKCVRYNFTCKIR